MKIEDWSYGGPEHNALEDIQVSIINASGKFFRQEELLRLTVEDLICLMSPNGLLPVLKRKGPPLHAPNPLPLHMFEETSYEGL